MKSNTADMMNETHQKVWRLAVPMIISSLSIPLLGMVDTAVMGHLPQAHYLGAVALGSTIFSFLFWGFGFLRMGTTGLAAQAFGQSDVPLLKLRLLQSLTVAWVCAGLLLVLQFPLIRLALWLFSGSELVESGAADYFSVRIWAAPITLSNYVLVGFLLGMQRARAAMWMLLTANIINGVLDLIFVVGLGWDVKGVAAASVFGELAALLVGLKQLHHHFEINGLFRDWRSALKMEELSGLLAVNRDLMLRTLCLIFAFAFFTDRSAALGETVLAVNAVLLNFQSLMAYGLDGFAHAAEALAGQAVGSGKRKAFRAVVRATGIWSGIVALGFCLVYAVFGNQIVSLLTDLQDVRELAQPLLIWVVITPILSVWSFWMDGVYIGATWATAMRNVMFISVFLILIPLYWLFRPWGNQGLWLAFCCFLSARSLLMVLMYRSLNRQLWVGQQVDGAA